eukprot:6484607-Amphidinium_carterae.1
MARGLILCRDCGLSRNDQNSPHCWLKGDHTLANVVEAVCKLETPTTTSMPQRNTLYQEHEKLGHQGAWQGLGDEKHGDEWTEQCHPDVYWQGENWQEEIWGDEGDSALFHGLSEDMPLDENTIQTVLTVYPAVHEALKKDVLARGYSSSMQKGKGREKGKPKGKGRGYFGLQVGNKQWAQAAVKLRATNRFCQPK